VPVQGPLPLHGAAQAVRIAKGDRTRDPKAYRLLEGGKYLVRRKVTQGATSVQRLSVLDDGRALGLECA